jgi:hypothetical protein
MKGLIEELKEREFRGYEYEAANASFKLLVAKWLGQRRSFFEVEGYRVIIERHGGELWAEATVKLRSNGEPVHTVAESTGPIGALDLALRRALDKTYPQLREMTLRDYKVRILDSSQGAGARTRVLIESGDGQVDLGHGGGQRQHHRRQLGGPARRGRIHAHAQASEQRSQQPADVLGHVAEDLAPPVGLGLCLDALGHQPGSPRPSWRHIAGGMGQHADLEIDEQAAHVEVRRAEEAEAPVDDDRLGVKHPFGVD